MGQKGIALNTTHSALYDFVVVIHKVGKNKRMHEINVQGCGGEYYNNDDTHNSNYLNFLLP